jgi:hypothetical protein
MEQKTALLVTRDGQIDADYYDAIWRAKRVETLRTAGREALQLALHVPLAAAKGMVWLLTHDLPNHSVTE